MKKYSAFGYTVVLFFTFLLLAGCIGCTKKSAAQPARYSLDGEPLLPQEGGYADTYVYANPLNSSWSKEECEMWFTAPEGSLLEQLKDSNDMMVHKILENAP